jgi:hypothetical protein
VRNLLVARFVRRIGISEISAVVTEKKKFIWQTRKTRVESPFKTEAVTQNDNFCSRNI